MSGRRCEGARDGDGGALSLGDGRRDIHQVDLSDEFRDPQHQQITVMPRLLRHRPVQRPVRRIDGGFVDLQGE